MNSLVVFYSHWYNFAYLKPLLFFIGSTDQLDRFCPTVSRLFGFWLNASSRPRGKQKTWSFCDCVSQNLVAECGDRGVFLLLLLLLLSFVVVFDLLLTFAAGTFCCCYCVYYYCICYLLSCYNILLLHFTVAVVFCC